MCQHVVLLAQRAGQRYISQCEHGTIHFVWDGVGLHLPANTFLQLAQQLLQSGATFHVELERSKQEHFYLQAGRVMVALPSDEYLTVMRLIDEALPHINRQKQDISERSPRLSFPQKRRSVILN